MRNTLLNFRNLATIRVPSQWLASSLVLGFLGSVGCTTSPTTSSSPASQASPQKAADQWVGQWQVTNPGSESGQTVTFLLTQEGKLFVLSPEVPSGKPIAYEIPIKKVSEATTLPPNTEVVDIQKLLGEQAQNAQASEAEQYISSLNRAQQAYYLENKKFAATLEELKLEIPLETVDYRYQIVPQDNPAQSVVTTAAAKRPELRSYTGVVSVVEANDQQTTVVQTCETEDPSPTPPELPKAISNDASSIECPEGSQSIKN